MIKDKEEFNSNINKIKDSITKITKMKNHILDNEYTLEEYLKESETLDRTLELVYTYASMVCDTDTTNNEYQVLKSQAEKIYDEVQDKLSFIRPEILSKNKKDVDILLDKTPYLKQYKLSFEKFFRYKKYTLSDKEEILLSKICNVLGSSSEAFYNLNNADIKLGTIKDDKGKRVELTSSNYSKYVSSNIQEVRKSAYNTLYKYYKNHKNTITALLKSKIKENVTLSNIRGFNSPLEQSMYQDNIDPKVYLSLIEKVHANLDTMYEYMELRKEILSLPKLNMYDIYVNLSKQSNRTISYDEAKDIIISSLSPLGEDYIENLKKSFEERWIDVYPKKGKKSGAYSWGCYDSYPYLLLNYENDLDSLSTLAHELGHSMHSYYSKQNQIYEYANYPIFLAEIASTVNEILLNEYLYRNAKNSDDKILYLNEFLDKVRTTIYRQTMFAEFEKIMHDKEQQNIPLTEQEFSNTYYELNKLYYGDNVISDDLIRYEWMRIPHFYTSFYVYKYATGLSCAIYIAYSILNNNTKLRDNYLKFLSSGGNGYPLDILKIVGIDLTTGEVIDKSLDIFKEKLIEFKNLIRK